MVFNANEGLTDITAGDIYLDTFMCGASTGGICPSCHTSCGACDGSDICLICKSDDSVLETRANAFCTCPISLDWAALNYFADCGIGPPPPPSCFPGCVQCVGPSEAACMDNADQVAFVKIAEADYQLPILDESDGAFCFYQRIPNSDCNPITALVGVVNADSTGLHPTQDQCYTLLKANWLFVTHWFGKLFRDFTLPTTPVPTVDEAYKTKSVLWLWILQYGPHALSNDPLWVDIVTTFNDNMLDWTRLLAWKGVLTGYSPDGVQRKSFPEQLAAALTSTSPELQLFNRFSTLCSDVCALGAECQQLNPANSCS